MLTSKKINKAKLHLDNKLREIMNDRCIIASYLMSPSSKIANPEHTSHYKLAKNSGSKRGKVFLKKINTSYSV